MIPPPLLHPARSSADTAAAGALVPLLVPLLVPAPTPWSRTPPRVAGTVAASDATAAIVLVEDDQPRPSTSKEEGAAAAATAATEATVATEKGEKKKEVNRKGVCMRWTNPAPAPPRAQTLTFGRRQVPQSSAGLGGGRAGWGRRNSLGFAPLPFHFSPPGGRGRGAGAARGDWFPLSRGWGAGEPPTKSPRPRSRSRNWGNGWDGADARKKPPASPSPLALSPPLPVGLCLGNLGPSIPHSRKGVCWRLIFLKFEFPGAGGGEAEEERGETFTSLIGSVGPLGGRGKKRKKIISCSFGPRLLSEAGVSPEKMGSRRCTPTPSIQTPN